MTEPQEIKSEDDAGRPDDSGEVEDRARVSTIEAGGKTWTLVGLEDGESWNLHAGPPDASRSPRVAHITISDRGYFSVDPGGTVRGPYVTLSEAAYPLALGDPVLLDGRAPTQPPSHRANQGTDRKGASPRREVLLVLLGGFLAVVVQRLLIRRMQSMYGVSSSRTRLPNRSARDR